MLLKILNKTIQGEFIQEVTITYQLRSIVLVKKIFVFFVFCFDNQFRIYKPTYVPHVSLTIRTLDILHYYYFKATFIKIFAR